MTGRRAPQAASWEDVRRVHPGRRRRDPAVVALDGLVLEAPAGELLVLVGPSGSGKSTALRTLAGIEPLDGGRVTLGGRDLAGVAPHRRDIAMVFQDLALFPHLAVRDNILFGPALRGEAPAERGRRLAEVAEVLQLGDVLDRRPSALSGGQRQRVALARAMVRDPAVFLLDEPLRGLDPQLRDGARAEVVALQRRLGSTVVHVTHDQAEAMTMAQRLAVVRDGRVEQAGTPREVYDAPATAFVARFLGSPAMNLLPASTALAPVGGPGQVGVRPEDLRVGAAGGDGSALPGVVARREDLGSEVVLHVTTADGPLAVRCGPRDPHQPGDAVALAVAADGVIHRFDEAGRRTGAVPGAAVTGGGR